MAFGSFALSFGAALRVARICSVAWVVVLISAMPANAQQKAVKAQRGKVMLVLDASGSMWGQIGGQPKIAIAREVVRDLMKEWDETLDLGLSAYGHRRKGDCRDIETLIPVSKAKPDNVVRIVDGLNPKGKTPLSEAVKRAALALKYRKQQGIVILVSDGEETCGADPCAVGKALAEAGVDFTAHVIGFDVTKSKQAGLRCLAENTGGSFFAAKDAGELLTSLEGALEKTKAVAGPNLRFKASLTEGGKPLRREYVTWVIGWDMLKAEPDAKGKRQRVANAGDAQVGFELPPGKYVADLRWDVVRREHPFEVKEGERAEHIVNLDAGIGVFTAVLSDGGQPIKGQVGWTFHEAKAGDQPGKEFAYKAGNIRTIVVPAGRNVVLAGFDNARKAYPFTIEAGKRSEHVVVLIAGIANFAAVGAGGEPVKGYKTWAVHKAQPDGKTKQVAFKSGYKPSFVLPAGRYQMQLGHDKRLYTADFEVKEGATANFTVTVPKP